jgi:hypothetical protein
MPDEPISLDDINDSAAVEAEMRRLRESAPQEPPEGTPDIGPETAPETPPVVKVEPETEAPPVDAVPEPKPEPKVEPTPEERQKEGTLQRLLRAEKKRREELERLLAAKETPAVPVERPKEPTYEDDPAEYLKRRTESQEQEIQRLRQEVLAREQQSAVERAEANFERQHPDYRDATQYLTDLTVRQWRKSGLARVETRQLAEAVAKGRQGDANFRAYAQHIDALARNDAVIQAADKDGRDPEDVAIEWTARDSYVTRERQKIFAGAAAEGRTVPEVAYEVALESGYQPKAKASTESPQKQSPIADNGARQRVLQAKEISESASSLSDANTGGTAPGPRIIRNRQDIIALDDNALDVLINSEDYKKL